jgi:hypothetical protein
MRGATNCPPPTISPSSASTHLAVVSTVNAGAQAAVVGIAVTDKFDILVKQKAPEDAGAPDAVEEKTPLS